MSSPLIVRYTSDWPSPWSPEGERIYGARDRGERLIKLTERQIAAQEKAAQQIALSNLAGAQVVARELRQQTQELSSTVENVGDRISSQLFQATHELRSEIEQVGTRICASLDEVRWQLAQQGDTLRGILEALRESRRVEAMQLVRQGVLLFDNREFDEAEDTFLEALRQDKTDYQVLLNLAFIEIHKDRAEIAEGYFKKALHRPGNLNAAETQRILWAWAQLRHAEGDHAKALELADQALSLETDAGGEGLLRSSVYAAAAGERKVALQRIYRALEEEPTLFARAAVEPGLEPMREAVQELLLSTAAAAHKAAGEATACAREVLDKASGLAHVAEYEDFIAVCRDQVEAAERKLEEAGYADSLKIEAAMRVRRRALEHIAELDLLYAKEKRAQAARDEAHENDERTKSQHGKLDDEKEFTGLPIWGCVVILGVFALIGGYCRPGVTSGQRPMHDVREVALLGISSATRKLPMIMGGGPKTAARLPCVSCFLDRASSPVDLPPGNRAVR